MAKVCISHFYFNQVIVNVQRTCVWVKQIRHLNKYNKLKQNKTEKTKKSKSKSKCNYFNITHWKPDVAVSKGWTLQCVDNI